VVGDKVADVVRERTKDVVRDRMAVRTKDEVKDVIKVKGREAENEWDLLTNKYYNGR
jgi:hypothetical protein